MPKNPGQGVTSIADGGTGVPGIAGADDTSGVAVVSTPSLSTGVAAQLSTAFDVDFYINVKIASTLAVLMGPTSTPANTIVASGTAGIGLVSIRVPRGWYVQVTFTSADVTFTQVSC
jgi:hypothetical protein